ncbi:MAG: hypothetical protein R2909_04920 [Gemmatimonadales bacterium]
MPAAAVFLLRWLPEEPRKAIVVVAGQVLLALVAVGTVVMLEYRREFAPSTTPKPDLPDPRGSGEVTDG